MKGRKEVEESEGERELQLTLEDYSDGLDTHTHTCTKQGDMQK